MNATVLGLAVAIPCMVAFSFLMSRSNNLISDLEEAAVQSLDILKQRYYTSEKLQSPFASNGTTRDIKLVSGKA
jgi:hypothetical protein